MTEPRKVPALPLPSAPALQWALLFAGLAFLCVAAFFVNNALGFAAIGASLIVCAVLGALAERTS